MKIAIAFLLLSLNCCFTLPVDKKDEPAAPVPKPVVKPAPKIPETEPKPVPKESIPKQQKPVPQKPQPVPKQKPVPQQPQPVPKEKPVPQQPQPVPKEKPVPQQPQPVPKEKPVPQQPQPVPKEKPVPQQPQPVPKQKPVPQQPQPVPKQQPIPQQPQPIPQQPQPVPKQQPVPQQPQPAPKPVPKIDCLVQLLKKDAPALLKNLGTLLCNYRVAQREQNVAFFIAFLNQVDNILAEVGCTLSSLLGSSVVVTAQNAAQIANEVSLILFNFLQSIIERVMKILEDIPLIGDIISDVPLTQDVRDLACSILNHYLTKIANILTIIADVTGGLTNIIEGL